MIPEIRIELPDSTQALLKSAPAWPARLTRNLSRTLDHENQLTTGHISKARLTGKGPFPVSQGRLGVVTNRYRKSLRPAKAIIVSGSIVSAIGSNVRSYPAAHEFGFKGRVTVREHQRRVFVTRTSGGGKYLDPKTGRIRTQRKRKVSLFKNSVTVRAHSRDLDIPERAPLRRGIQDRVSNYRDALSHAIVATFTRQ